MQVRVAPDTDAAAASPKPTVVANPQDRPSDLARDVGVPGPRPVLLVIGGAGRMDPAIATGLARIFEREVLPAVRETNAVVLDGGTDAGVIRAVGRATADLPATVVGVAPRGKVNWPDNGPDNGDRTDRDGDRADLEPHHSHFVLADSEEWGGETPLLFDLAAAIAGRLPMVTLVAGGGPLSLEEVRMAARQRLPIVALEGTGGVADALAAAADPAAHLSPDDPMAGITRETDVMRVSAASEHGVLRRLLVRLLSEDATLRSAWRQQRAVDGTAAREQRTFKRQQQAILALGVALTGLVVVQSVLKSGGQLGGYPRAADLLHLAVVVVPIVIASLTAAASRSRPGHRWVVLRGTAELITSEIFQYRARAGAYSPCHLAGRPRQEKLARAVGSAMSALMRSDVVDSAVEPARGGSVSRVDGDDGMSPLTADDYLRLRVVDQMTFYRRRAAQFDRRARRFRWLMLVAGGLGTTLAALGFDIWVAVTTALVAAVAAYVESTQLESTVHLYNRASSELEAIGDWWTALPPDEQADCAALDRLVLTTERILQAERASWTQHIQDAMSKLQLEREAADTAERARQTAHRTRHATH